MHRVLNDKAIAETHRFTASSFYPPTYRHSHLFFEFSFGMRGKATNVINDIPFEFKRGVCTILRPSDNHYFTDGPSKTTKDYEHKDFYAYPDDFKALCDGINKNLYDKIVNQKEPIVFPISDETTQFCIRKAMYVPELMYSDPDKCQVIFASAILAILSQYIEHSVSIDKSKPAWLEDLLPKLNAIEYLNMSVTDIAKDTGYSAEHFSREFKKYMGVTFINYLTKKRMQYAAGLLMLNTYNVTDIAQLIGYSNPSTFCKHFYKEFNCTPSKYIVSREFMK